MDFDKDDILDFVKEHKYEILGAGIGIAGFLLLRKHYINVGLKKGLDMSSLIEGSGAWLNYGLRDEGYRFCIDALTKSGTSVSVPILVSNENAIVVAKDILTDLGCLKEIMEVPANG